VRVLLALVVLVLSAGCLGATPRESFPLGYEEEVLWSKPFRDLVVEVDHAPGRAPSPSAIEHLVSTLREVTRKSQIAVEIAESLPEESGKQWRRNELMRLEETTRDGEHRAPTALMRVLYVAGVSEETGVIGQALKGFPPFAVIYRDAFRPPEPAGPPLGTDSIERAVLVHEVGHVLGLVNYGVPMQREHEDPEHPHHSRNPDSVMYWSIDLQEGISAILGVGRELPDRFDADDLADLRAVAAREFE
jgi:hypothetical protein